MFKELGKVCKKNLYRCMVVAFVLFLGVYCCYGIYRVHNHWWKSDERAVISYWYENNCMEEMTLVDFKQRLTFLYYLQESDNYREEYLDSIQFNMSEESVQYSVEEWKDYITEHMDVEDIPDSFYVSTGYYSNLIKALEEMGYQSKEMIETTTDFYYMWKE